MNERQKQIEQMAEDFENIDVYGLKECEDCGLLDYNDCDTECFCKQSAKYFYNVGYRKIPEGVVVLMLTRDEFETLKNGHKLLQKLIEEMSGEK